MALSVGSGENKQKLIKILVFVPSGSIVGFTRSARASAGANKNRHLKTFRTRKPTARFLSCLLVDCRHVDLELSIGWLVRSSQGRIVNQLIIHES